MKRTKLFIIASLDGYPAFPWDENPEWFFKFQNSTKTDYGYMDFSNSTDTVVMDEIVYNAIISMDVNWPFKEKYSYVISPFERKSNDETVVFVRKDDEQLLLTNLKNQPGKDIWLIGYNAIMSFFDVVDEIQLVYIPVIHGNSHRFFPENLNFSYWTLRTSETYENGVIRLVYQRK